MAPLFFGASDGARPQGRRTFLPQLHIPLLPCNGCVGVSLAAHRDVGLVGPACGGCAPDAGRFRLRTGGPAMSEPLPHGWKAESGKKCS